MKTLKKSISLIAMLVIGIILIVGCKKDERHPLPSISVEKTAVTSSSVSFKITFSEADIVMWTCAEKGSEIKNIADILKNGKSVSVENGNNSLITASGLKAATTYVVTAVASGKGGEQISSIEVDTEWFVFNSASAVNYGGTNYAITFTAQSGETLLLDMYCSQYKYLPQGVYIVNGTDNPKIDVSVLDYTNFTSNGKKIAVKSGTVDVKVDNEKAVYDILFDLILDGDVPLKAKFSGNIDGAKIYDEIEFKLTSAKRLDVDNVIDGQFYIKLNDENWDYEASFNFYAKAGLKELPEGKYTVGEGNSEGTLGNNSMINPYKVPGVSGGKLKSGTIDVTKNGNNYTFIIEVVDVNNQKFKGKFEGEIENMILPLKIEFTSAVTEIYNSDLISNYCLTFNDKNGNKLVLDSYFDRYKYLAKGTYTVGTSKTPYIDNSNSNYTYFYFNNKSSVIESGSMVVIPDLDTKIYAITFDLVLNDGSIIKGSYNGTIDNSPIFDEFNFTVNNAKRIKNNGAVPGEFYIKLNDSDWKFDVVLDLFTQDGTLKELPEGTYKFSETGLDGFCFGPKSEITCDKQAVKGGKFKSGTIEVSKNGTNYTIKLDAVDINDQRFVGSFIGEIKDMIL
jgi:hypothetical protein